MKTNKSFTKRIRVTKNGKLMIRKSGQDHFNAKNPGSKTVSKRRVISLSLSRSVKKRFLPRVPKQVTSQKLRSAQVYKSKTQNKNESSKLTNLKLIHD